MPEIRAFDSDHEQPPGISQTLDRVWLTQSTGAIGPLMSRMIAPTLNGFAGRASG